MAAVARYGEDLARIHAAGFTALAVAGASELLERLPRPARVVEFGCGDGTTARLLTEAGHEVLGIDASPTFITLARERAPRAAFRVGSFVDVPLPEGCDAILAIGEVLGYRHDERNAARELDRVFVRAAQALRRGGLLLFDLPRPDRIPRTGQRDWRQGEGWAVLVEAATQGSELRRHIVTFRDAGAGCFRRAEEAHRLSLHMPSEILVRLRSAGFSARTLPRGYAGEPLPSGLTAYIAHKR
jgi:SAM-dependent methyltransferase